LAFLNRYKNFEGFFMKKSLMLACVILFSTTQIAQCERIKDIVDIQGIRSNPITAIGLVIGLAGTGDSTQPSKQILTNLYREAGIVLNPTDAASANVAVVMVTAELGPFSREGSRLDVEVSSIGDAKSLQGGLLLPTPLKGLDDQAYAVAQGPISLGGWAATGDTAKIAKNHQTVGRIPSGATVENAELANFVEQVAGCRFITLSLRNNDFTTAQRISAAINQNYADSAVAVDAGTIKIRIPEKITDKSLTGFIDTITNYDVKVDVPAVVVINERTGTIVVGENVGISEVAIAQGSLVIKIKETATVSQPNAAPFAESTGTTEVIPDTIIDVEEKDGYLIPVPQTITVQDLARTLNSLGVTPRDLIAIFNALKKAGALQARLEIM
jgi:flagellar P-ring protein FlgI